MMITLLYVSISNLSDDQAPLELANLVPQYRIRNAALGVTGAMIFTGRHFAQALEGPETGVRDLMTSISRDKSHRQITIVNDHEISERRFATWQLAYQGPSQYVGSPIGKLFQASPSEARGLVDQIYSPMSEFARV